MTCRCGARFCFSCGSLAAACSCTSEEHDFFEHRHVLRSYIAPSFKEAMAEISGAFGWPSASSLAGGVERSEAMPADEGATLFAATTGAATRAAVVAGHEDVPRTIGGGELAADGPREDGDQEERRRPVS